MITSVKKIIKNIWIEITFIPQLIYALLCSTSKKYIIVQAWCKYKPFALFREVPIVHNNWGDDINLYFIELITQKKVIIYPNSRIARLISLKRYFFIGSILTGFSLENATICGSGIINEKRKYNTKGIPSKIISVRGPLTYRALIEKGYLCPPNFGDPALLLPLYYMPNTTKKWKICIIPHHSELNIDFIQDMLKNNFVDIHIIKMRGYAKWTDVIDDICSCDVVLSSSLHGLIVSETYGVPCFWIYLSEYEDGWDFKFFDFYSSINKNDVRPYVVKNTQDVWRLYEQRIVWKKGDIHYDDIQNTTFFDFIHR